MSHKVKKHFFYRQGSFRSARAFPQSHQNFHWAHFQIAKNTKFLHVNNEDSDENARNVQADLSSFGAHIKRYVFIRRSLRCTVAKNRPVQLIPTRISNTCYVTCILDRIFRDFHQC